MRFLALLGTLALLGCNKPDVYVVNSPKDARRCAPDEGAYLTQDGRVAVCMPKHVAAFTMCATSIGAGNYEGTDRAETHAETGNGRITFKAGHGRSSTRRLAESGSDAILRARAVALRACLTVLCGGRDCATVPRDDGMEPPPRCPPGLPPPPPDASSDAPAVPLKDLP